MKIINTDTKPYHWTFDGCYYGPLLPGQVGDYPDEVANHAIKRGVILDGEGNFVRHTVEALSSLSAAQVRNIALYECPFTLTNQCDSKPFKTANDLKAHLEDHWTLAPGPMVVEQQPAARAQAPTRK